MLRAGTVSFVMLMRQVLAKRLRVGSDGQGTNLDQKVRLFSPTPLTLGENRGLGDESGTNSH